MACSPAEIEKTCGWVLPQARRQDGPSGDAGEAPVAAIWEQPAK